MPSIFSLPLTLALPPLLLLISLPLAAFAVLTTVFAFATLLIRLGIVYSALGSALVRSYFFTVKPKAKSSGTPQLHISASNISLTQQRRSRRGSAASFASIEQQPSTRTFGYGPHHRNDSLASLLGAGSQGPARDFEGLGGWRNEDEDPERESLWLGMNRRLELPAAPPVRWHRRSGTGSSHASLVGGNNNTSQANLGPVDNNKRWSYGSGVWSPEALRMSPVQSRARTPSLTERVVIPGQDEEEYFGLQMPKAGTQTGEVLVLKGPGKETRRKSLGTEAKETKRDKSKSSSGDSISSMGSKVTVRRAGH
jgi:hypothetical protein